MQCYLIDLLYHSTDLLYHLIDLLYHLTDLLYHSIDSPSRLADSSILPKTNPATLEPEIESEMSPDRSCWAAMYMTMTCEAKAVQVKESTARKRGARYDDSPEIAALPPPLFSTSSFDSASAAD